MPVSAEASFLEVLSKATADSKRQRTQNQGPRRDPAVKNRL
jgi:hypothetical protein